MEASDPAQRRTSAFRRMVERAGHVIVGWMREGAAPDEAIDCAYEDSEVLESLREYMHWSKVAPLDRTGPDTLEARFPWVVGLVASPPVRRSAVRCVELLNAIEEAHRQLQQSGVQFRAAASQEVQEQDPLFFVGDTMVPLALRRALLAHRRAILAIVATYPFTRPTVQPDAFRYVRSLLEFSAAGLEEYLRVLANIPEAGVTLVAPDGSDLAIATDDVVQPFRDALRVPGEDDGAVRA